MASIKTKFQLIDEMSDKLERIAQSGQSISAQFESIGTSANIAFDGISGGIQSAVSSCDGVATSISSIRESEEDAISCSDAFSDSLNSVDETLETFDSAMQKCEQSGNRLSNAIDTANKSERNLSEAMEQALRLSDELSNNDTISAEAKDNLANASQEAERAMNALTEAEQRANEAMEEYNRILDSGTEDLGQLSTAADRANRAALELEAANRVAADATHELSSATEQASDTTESAAERGENAIKTLESALAAAGIAKLVSEIAGAFMEASGAAAEFETATMKISTIADTTQVSLSQISSDLISLSAETGISVTGLSEATYQAISASVDTADAVNFTATASKLAAGGFTSSATAVDVLTTALNAYGLEAGQATSISDMLITTQNLGKTSVDQLAASVGKVIPLASAYGVEMDNLSAAYAELTKGGIATAEAGTYLKSMLNELGDSGSMVSSVLLEQTGQSFSQLMEQGYSLGDVMAVLGESVGGNAGAFNELWSSSEAGIGALSLYNAGAEQFNSTLDAMQNSIGATDSAYETMTDTTAHAQEELANAANNLKISIGDGINPLIEKMLNFGTDILNWITEFTQEHPVITKFLTATTIGVAAFGAALSAVTVIKKLFFVQTVANTAATAAEGVASAAAVPPILALGAAINAALGPIGWVVAGVTALTVAIGAFIAMASDTEDETEGMTAATRAQYYELQNLNDEYERACEQYGENSEEALRLKYQVDDLSAAFEANQQTVEEFTAEVDALCESVTELADEFNNSITEINASETGTLALIQKYEDLSSQANKGKVEMQELEAITKKLSDTYPDLAAQLDNTTLSAEDYVTAMEKACEQEAERQRQQQAQDTYTKMVEEQGHLKDEIEKTEELIRLEQERMDNMSGWEHLWTAGEWDDLEAYQDALEELNATQEENNATIAQIKQQWADIAEAAAEETMSWEDAVSTAYENVKGKVIELCEAYGEVYNAALESFEGQFGLFDEASMKSDEYLNSTVENAQKALDSQLAYWDSYLANVEALKATSAEDLGITKENYEALMAYTQDGSEQAAGLAASMVQAIQNGDEEAVAALANTMGEVSAKQEEIAAATADWVTDFTAQMDQIEQEMQSTIDGMNLDTEAAAAATATINAYANSIRAGKGGAVSAAEEVANAVSAAFSSARTTVNVNVSSSGKVPGHANGTTNAEPVFLAGEEGPELVARPAAAYAGGTTDSTDFFIAGENGPELIIGEQGSTVFPTEETDRLIGALNNRERPLQVLPETGGSGAESSTEEQVKRILLEVAGSGAIEVGGNGGADKETILGVLYEHLKPVLMSIIQSEIYEEGDLSYEY